MSEETTQPNLDVLRDEKVVPVARGVLVDMATDLLPNIADESADYSGMVTKLMTRVLEADLNIVTENPYLLQLILGVVAGLNKTVNSMELTPIDEQRYMDIGRKILSIIATANIPMGGTTMTPEEEVAAFAPVKEQLAALFASEKLNLMEVQYIMNQVFDSFQAVQNTFMVTVANFSQKAEAKALGLEDFSDLSMKKINDVLTAPVKE